MGPPNRQTYRYWRFYTLLAVLSLIIVALVVNMFIFKVISHFGCVKIRLLAICYTMFVSDVTLYYMTLLSICTT